MAATKVIKTGAERFELVFRNAGDENAVGFITKFRNTRTDSHPWKAFVITGPHKSDFLGSYFPQEGGKDAAIAAILAK
jgi:hypothetical protein